jgi:hypothetical protein
MLKFAFLGANVPNIVMRSILAKSMTPELWLRYNIVINPNDASIEENR